MLGRIKNSEFAKSVLVLAGGNTIAQLISFLSLPILQRWFYSPSEFGLLAIYNSVATILIAIATLKLEYAIILAKSNEEAIAIRKVTTRTVRYFSLFTLSLIVAFGLFIDNFANNNQIYIYFYLIPINMLFAGTYEAYNYWYNYRKEYKILAVSKIVQTTVAEFFKYFFKIIFTLSGGLIFGRILGQAASFLTLIINRKINSRNQTTSNFKSIEIIKENKNFPLFVMPTVFINTATNSVLILFLAQSFSSHEVGLISASIVYLQTPLGILSRSVSQVFYKKISEISSHQNLLEVYKRFSIYLLAIIIVPVLFVLILPNQWFEFVLGQAWKDIGIYMKIMVIWIGISFISSSLSFIYNRIQRQKLIFFLALSQLIGVFLCLIISINYFEASLKTTIIVYTIFQATYYLSAILFVLILLKTRKA